MALRVGSTVISKAIGSRGQFTGTIHERKRGYFHVKDSAGVLWHRTEKDLTHVKVTPRGHKCPPSTATGSAPPSPSQPGPSATPATTDGAGASS